MSASVLAALRDGTRAEHDQIELALDWQARASRRDRYARWLGRLQGFHQAWEPAVAAAVADPAFVEPRLKLHLLASDLDRLRMPAGASGSFPPVRFGSRAEALGSMYVIEGSTLGGQVIARHVAATLGHDPAYHGAYGRQTAAMWRAFGAYVASNVVEADTEAAMTGARTTFVRLREWLTAD